MRIGIISSSVFPVPPSTYGGLERVVYDLAVELGRMGEEVTLFAPKGSRAVRLGKDQESLYRVMETVEPQMRVHVDWLGKEAEAWRAIEPNMGGFDIIHDHSWFAHVYVYKMAHPELRVIHTHHGMDPWRDQVGRPSLPPVQYPCLVGISNDHSMQMSLQTGLCYRTAYNGVNLKLYPFREEKGERFLFLSRITSIKGANVAIDVAKKKRIPLDLCGGTQFVDDQAYVLRIQQMCDGHLIRFIGEVSENEKVERLQSAKALLFPPQPPFREPFGLVPVEAMACGTPVIALRNGALPEVVKDGVSGFLCNTAEEMMEAVDRVDEIEPKACRKWAENFSREKMCERYFELYGDVLRGIEW